MNQLLLFTSEIHSKSRIPHQQHHQDYRNHGPFYRTQPRLMAELQGKEEGNSSSEKTYEKTMNS
ncbi:hypothetical protein T03_14824 [Trichinella britovi]|uniref:Uncharacterized protein n=1 Tax=Trichinella britovi TaxID=45882 RepID=A0A0V1D566_TRIBR|nr:hypothetical protein T03_14824 [Trichinella britovi]